MRARRHTGRWQCRRETEFEFEQRWMEWRREILVSENEEFENKIRNSRDNHSRYNDLSFIFSSSVEKRKKELKLRGYLYERRLIFEFDLVKIYYSVCFDRSPQLIRRNSTGSRFRLNTSRVYPFVGGACRERKRLIDSHASLQLTASKSWTNHSVRPAAVLI